MVSGGWSVTNRLANHTKPCNLPGFASGAWRPFKKIGGNFYVGRFALEGPYIKTDLGAQKKPFLRRRACSGGPPATKHSPEPIRSHLYVGGFAFGGPNFKTGPGAPSPKKQKSTSVHVCSTPASLEGHVLAHLPRSLNKTKTSTKQKNTNCFKLSFVRLAGTVRCLMRI